jgi:tRNA1Val (adenine37-N6)-methyltransferase
MISPSIDVLLPEDETLDTFHRGRVIVLQKKKGYRFSLDAAILADFVRIEPGEDVVELGAGNGIVALLLARKPFRRLAAVEIQPALADLARRNVVLNELADRIDVVEADLRGYAPGRVFDVAYSNPPYIRKSAGFPSASEEKTIAKHEITCDILDVLRAAARLLKPAGRAYIVYPGRRRSDLEAAAGKAGLRIHALRPVLPREGAPAGHVLAELGSGPGEARILPPLVLFDAAGGHTPEARAIFEGRDRGPAFP